MLRPRNSLRPPGRPLRRRIAAGCVAALLVAAQAATAQTAPDARAARFYEDALVRYEKNDYAGAIIQLKNALQIDKRQLPVHVLMGRALLASGDVLQAEVSFSEALRLGVSRAEVAVPMAQALIGQGKPDVVLSDPRLALDGLSGSVRFRLLLLHAGAAAEVGDAKRAMRAIEEARAIDPGDAESWNAEVPIRIRARQLREALAAADRAIALAPTNVESHYARGEALHVVPDLAGALSSYERAISLDPGHVAARVARAGIYVDQNRLDAALRDLEVVQKSGARDPRATFLKAVIAERQGRPADARSALNEVTALLDPIPPQFLRYRPQIQMLGGLAHYGLGQREKARPYLEGVLRTQPGHPVAKVLASIYLSDRNIDSAIDVLGSYVRVNPGDTQAQVLLASAHMAQGRHGRATQLMQDALRNGDRPELRTALGLSFVGGARYADALKELEAAFAKDPKSLPTGYALASLYVQSGQGARAVRVAEAVSRAHPGNAGVLALLGSARRLVGDAAGARAALQAATAADPALLSAHLGLARLEIDANAMLRARERLQQALALDERHVPTLLALAEVADRSGQLADARRWLLKADEVAVSGDASGALALVELNLRHGDLDAAREAAARAAVKAPDAVPVLMASARVNLRAGESAAARASLSRAAASAGFNVGMLTEIAALQVEAGAASAAAHSLDKALSERPDHLPAQILRTEVDIRLGDLASAEQRARQIIARHPRLGAGHALLGDVAGARGQRDASLAAYRQAHELDRNATSLLRVFAATLPRNAPAAFRLAEQWVASHQRDAVVWRALADTYLNAGQLDASRRAYERLLTLRPDDVDAINNLANVLIAQNDAGALGMAERAMALAPGAPHVVGTTGWAAFKAGQPDRALRLLRDARLRDPANPDTRYFLGSVLASLGRTTEAREELQAAVRPGAAIGRHRADAEQLLGTLR